MKAHVRQTDFITFPQKTGLVRHKFYAIQISPIAAVKVNERHRVIGSV
jgi:hypothetical protein